MTTRDDLHHLVDKLDEAAADELLEYAHWLSQAEDTLTDEERERVEAGKAEIARGDYVSLEELRRKLALNATSNACHAMRRAASSNVSPSSP